MSEVVCPIVTSPAAVISNVTTSSALYWVVALVTRNPPSDPGLTAAGRVRSLNRARALNRPGFPGGSGS